MPEGRGYENFRLVDRAYGRLTPDELRAIATRYGAQYAVLPHESAVALPVVHETRKYRLVQLRVPSGRGP